MAGDRARSGLRETMAEFVKRRQREVENFGQEAEAAARDAYGRATRAGEDLILRTPSEVMRYGAGLVNGNLKLGEGSSSRSTPVDRVGPARPATVDHERRGSWLDRNAGARAVVGDAARMAGLVPGAMRGAWHTAEDVVHGLDFATRLFDPYDAEYSPRGDAAWDKVFSARKGIVDYAANAISNPSTVADDVGASLHRFQVRTDPAASPPADTFGGEAARNFNIGLNRGEALFDAGSLLYGGGEVKGLIELGEASEGAGAAKYLARGYPAGLSDYFATPYDGMGHHVIARRTELPPLLGGGPVPPAISESPFFLLKPPGISTGDFFETHVRVDPYYHGGKVPAEFGGGSWSGKDLGWEKYDPLGRAWYGSPAPLKAAAGAGLAGAGAAVDQAWDGEGPP